MPGVLPVVKNPERDCPNYDMHTCGMLSICVWECEESKCVQTSDANSACSPGVGGMMPHPYGAIPGQMPMNTMPYQQPMMTGARTMPMTGAMPGAMPGAYQTGVQPGYSSVGTAQAGYAQPGIAQAGYAQPGYAQPMHPGAMQAGYVQPGLMAAQPGYGQAGMNTAAYSQTVPGQPGYAAGAGYSPATGMMGAQPGFSGAYAPMGAQPGYAAASPTGFGHGAFAPIRPVLSSIRRTNTTLQHTAYGVGAYPGAAPMGGAYPRAYPAAGAYPRGATYPRTGAYGAYSNPKTATQTGMYAYPPKHKKYTMSTTFTYALLIVTPFLIICSFCMGKFVGGKGSGGVTPGAVITTNPDLMQPIHMDNTYYSQMHSSSHVDPEGPGARYTNPEVADLEKRRSLSRRKSRT